MEFLEQLLNVELGLPARFLIAFVFVLLLIALTAWIIRRIASRSSLVGGLRARQHRITVIDSAGIDAKRRLVLVRWDNSEHLLLVGGDTDIVVDSNGARRGPASERAETADLRAPMQEEVPRPAAAMRPVEGPAPVPARERQAPPRPTAPTPRPTAPSPPRGEAPVPTPTPVPERSPPPVSRPAADEGRRERPSPFAALRRVTGVGRSEEQPEAPRAPEARPEPRPSSAPRTTPATRPTAEAPSARPSPAAPTARPATEEGQRAQARGGEQLEEMATRLEAALKRPMGHAPAPSGPGEQASSTEREMSTGLQRPGEPQRGASPAAPTTGAPGSTARPAEPPRPQQRPASTDRPAQAERPGASERPASERPASWGPRPTPGEGGVSGSGSPSRPSSGTPENPFASSRPQATPTAPQRPSGNPPASPGSGERSPGQPSSSTSGATPQRSGRPAEADLAAAMAAELDLGSETRTGATPPPADQDRPRPSSTETESEKEDKNDKDDDLNIYEQILKRDT